MQLSCSCENYRIFVRASLVPSSFRLGFRVWGLGFRVWGLGVSGLGFGFWGLGFGVLGFRVSSYASDSRHWLDSSA